MLSTNLNTQAIRENAHIGSMNKKRPRITQEQKLFETETSGRSTLQNCIPSKKILILSLPIW